MLQHAADLSGAGGPFRHSRHICSATRWCVATASSAPVIMATPVWMLGRPSGRNGLIASVARSRARRILNELVGSAVGRHAELQAHRLGFHQVGDMLDFGGGDLTAAAAQMVGQGHVAGYAGLEEAQDAGVREDGDDTRPADAHTSAFGPP